MKLINNYLDSFENYLPDDSKREIRAELESSVLSQIEDKEQELGRSLLQEEQEQLLIKIGHPMRVASGYLPNQQLISNDFFPAYKKTLNISLMVYGVLTVLLTLPMRVADGMIFSGIINTFFSLIETSIWVFFCVTVIFYLMERYNINLDKLYEWSPKQLRHTAKKVSLSRLEIIFEMFFEGLFLVAWIGLFSEVEIFFGSNSFESVYLSPEWESVYWFVILTVTISIMLNFYKLLTAGWTRIGLIANIVIDAIYLVIVSIISQFNDFILIQPDEIGGVNLDRMGGYISINLKIILGVIAVFAIWDLYSSTKKLAKL